MAIIFTDESSPESFLGKAQFICLEMPFDTIQHFQENIYLSLSPPWV